MPPMPHPTPIASSYAYDAGNAAAAEDCGADASASWASSETASGVALWSARSVHLVPGDWQSGSVTEWFAAEHVEQAAKQLDL